MPTLEFKGKQLVYAHHLTVPSRTIELDAEKSLSPKGEKPSLDNNLIIHGDNLHALKALLPRYAGKVNCIYIDPPYNTGNERWVYNDNVNSPMMKEWLKDKNPVDGEDLERHDKWLCMMWPRLQLLRELLAEDGVIFVSIDDNEQHRLRMVMDEIFGEENFLANVVWQHRYGRSNNAKLFSNQREHIITYRKTKEVAHIRVKRREKLNLTYANPDNDPRGKWVSSSYVNPAKKEQRPNLVYPIKNPHTGNIVNHPTHAWKYGKDTHDNYVANNMLWWGKTGQLKYPRLKNFLSDSEKKGIVPIDLMLADIAGTTDEGTRLLQEIYQTKTHDFNNPKPTMLIKHLINISEGASNKEEFLILDSFAGSGTTAHAVLALNKEDGGNRKFILVECEDYANKITAERVRRVIKGVPKAKDENLKKGLGGSFTYCTLGDEMSIEKMLTGKNFPDYETLARHIYWTATGQSADKIRKAKGKDGLFHETKDRMYYLIYESKLDFLRSSGSALNSERAERIAKQAKTKKKTAVVFATHKFMGQKELTEMGIVFAQLPHSINGAI